MVGSEANGGRSGEPLLSVGTMYPFPMIRRAKALIALIVAGTLAIACGSSGPSLTQEEYCTAAADQYRKCNPGKELPGSVGANCPASYQCISAAYEGSFVDSLIDCGTASCSQGDSCYRAGIASAGRSAEEADKCAARYSECEAAKEKFDDDICPQLRVLKTDLVDAIVPCLAKPCDQIKSCIQGVVQNRGISCVDT